MYLSVSILRLKNGIEATKNIIDECTENGNGNNLSIHRDPSSDSFPRNQSYSRISYVGSVTDLSSNNCNNVPSVEPQPTKKVNNLDESKINYNFEVPKKPDPYAEQFLKKQGNGTIDVWWLYDDGGMFFIKVTISFFYRKSNI